FPDGYGRPRLTSLATPWIVSLLGRQPRYTPHRPQSQSGALALPAHAGFWSKRRMLPWPASDRLHWRTEPSNMLGKPRAPAAALQSVTRLVCLHIAGRLRCGFYKTLPIYLELFGRV